MICPKEKRVCPCDLGVIPPCSTADEFAAMARDAERYRWLRDAKNRRGLRDVGLRRCDKYMEQFDVAIDAAMAERNK